MTWKGRIGYLLAWCAVGTAVWLYVEHREVAERYEAYQESSERVRGETEKTASLDKEVADLQGRVQNLHTNPLEMESAIRRTKGLVRPGETVYRITGEKAPAGTPEPDWASETPARSGALEDISPEMD